MKDLYYLIKSLLLLIILMMLFQILSRSGVCYQKNDNKEVCYKIGVPIKKEEK